MEKSQRFTFSALIAGVLGLFFLTTFYMETTIEEWIEERITSELHENAKTINGVLNTVRPEFTVESLDPLVDQISTDSTHRTTIINADGMILADSQLNRLQISEAGSLKDRPELLSATKKKPGKAIHYSDVLKSDMLYLATPYSIGEQEGFVRVSISLGQIQIYLNNFRQIYLVTAVIASILLIMVLAFAFKYIQKLHNKNEQRLKVKVNEKTSDLVKIQKLSQILASCQEREELAEVITASADTLFPNTSGALTITHPSMDQNEVITSWGPDWQGQSIYHPSDCWAFNQGTPYTSHSHGLELRCKHMDTDDITLCVPLLAQSVAIGGLHFVLQRQITDEEYQQLTTMADHLSLALSNINLRESLKRQAIRDPLTNLYNRRYLDEAIENELLRAKRKQAPIGIMMIDIDHFKQFNDSFGHHAGDHTLQEDAKLMADNVRGEDTVSRYGGEEFMVIMPDSDIHTTVKRAELLIEKTRELSLSYKNKSLGHVTLSIGVSVFPDNGEKSATLISLADQALYKAKTNGRDQVQVALIEDQSNDEPDLQVIKTQNS